VLAAILAAVTVTVTVPAHALALRAPWPAAPTSPARAAEGAVEVGRSRPFLLLTAAFTLSGFATHAVVVALVPLLLERGYSTSQAAWALGIGGAGQTLGRTFYAGLARRTTTPVRTTILIALGALTTAAFAAVPGPYGLLITVSVVAGMVRGNLTLLQATAVTDRWGATHFGHLPGLLAAPATTAAALAPFAGASLTAPLGGYGPLFFLLATVSVAAALTAPWTGADALRRRSGRRLRSR
jgi:MFS family permease